MRSGGLSGTSALVMRRWSHGYTRAPSGAWAFPIRGCPVTWSPAPDGVPHLGHVATLPAGCRSNAGAACSEFRPPQVGRSAAGTKAVGLRGQFDAYKDAISFDAGVMDLPLVGYDPYLNELMVKFCEEAIAARTSNVSPFRTEVENTIAPLLPARRSADKDGCTDSGRQRENICPPVGSRGIELWRNPRPDAARSGRALSRRGRRPSSLANRVALGFQQPSAFSHACRRWTGKSPSGHRRSSQLMRSGAGPA